jgi:hypothetical protein
MHLGRKPFKAILWNPDVALWISMDGTKDLVDLVVLS